MKVNLKVQVVVGAGKDRKIYQPGETALPDALAKRCVEDGIATKLPPAAKVEEATGDEATADK